MTFDDLSQEHMLIHIRNARLELENQRLQQVLLHAEALLNECMVAARMLTEQEPVAWWCEYATYDDGPAVHLRTNEPSEDAGEYDVITPLYAAPPAPDAAPDLLAAATQAVWMMERAKKLLIAAGLPMDNGTISKPYSRALIDLQAAISHATGGQQ